MGRLWNNDPTPYLSCIFPNILPWTLYYQQDFIHGRGTIYPPPPLTIAFGIVTNTTPAAKFENIPHLNNIIYNELSPL